MSNIWTTRAFLQKTLGTSLIYKINLHQKTNQELRIMNYELKFHNIRVAWRNLMKYKVQNIISVLCLAVGVVWFSLFFICFQRLFEMEHRKGIDPRRVTIQISDKEAMKQDKDMRLCFTPKILKKISDKRLPSIQFIDFYVSGGESFREFTDLKGKRYSVNTGLKFINPEYLNYLGLKSAITGKSISVLKPGDIIMTQGMLNRSFGQEVSPIGFTTPCILPKANAKSYNTITDVVDTGDLWLTEDNLLVVTNLLQGTDDLFLNPFSMDIILAKGKSPQDLNHDLQKAFPKYHFNIPKLSKSKGKIPVRYMGLLFSTSFFMIIISGILLVGILGFLKMEIQLFQLRQREIALRQCMGANRSQLMGLLMYEIAIVFFFTSIFTVIISAILAHYAIPIISQQFANFYINLPRTYTTELWICLVVFLITIGIAALSVRKVVSTPLSKVVGKSHRTPTRGRNILTILQMTICMCFLIPSYVMLTSGYCKGARVNFKIPDNIEVYKNCVQGERRYFGNKFMQQLPTLQHIEGSTEIMKIRTRDTLYTEEPNDTSSDRWEHQQILLVEENFFNLLEQKVLPNPTKQEISDEELIPVCIAPQRAAHLRSLLGIKQQDKAQYLEMPDEVQAEVVGYTYGLFDRISYTGFGSIQSIYVRDVEHIDFMKWNEIFGENVSSIARNVIIKTRKGEYKKGIQELTDLYHEVGTTMQAKIPMHNVYEDIFRDFRTVKFMLDILFILTIVVLLCIVMTLFSSVTLDVRGRQKEVAIRKAHGAGTWQIIWLFGRRYLYQLIISSILSLLLWVGLGAGMIDNSSIALKGIAFKPYFASILILAIITFLTVGFKIYRVSRINPATIIKKE